MADAHATPSFALRRWAFRVAWLLLVASLLIPAPSALTIPSPLGISAVHVYQTAMAWGNAPIGSAAALGFWPGAVLALALFSHIAFLYSLYLPDDRGLALAWKALLIALVVIDAAVAVAVPQFARLPAYWVWLASIAALALGYVVLSSTADARGTGVRDAASDIERGDVPALVWVLLGMTGFWIAVSAINHASPPPDAATTATRDSLTGYINDRARVLKGDEAVELTRELQRFEEGTPNQIAIAIYPQAPSGSIDDFTIDTAERFPLGRAGLDTGAILFVFMAERAARLEVGYGLEGVLTDAQSHRILETALTPAFARGAYFEGLDATLKAIFADVQTADKSGGDAARPATWKRKIAAERPSKPERVWRAISQASLPIRIGTAILYAFIGLMLWSVVWHRSRLKRAIGRSALRPAESADWGRFLRDIARGISNLKARRPFTEGMERFDGSTIVDSIRLAFWAVGILLPTAGIILVAGGGEFGGAGSLVHW